MLRPLAHAPHDDSGPKIIGELARDRFWVLCRLRRLLDLGSKSSAGGRTHLEPTPLLIRHRRE
jgi:hypothetical protein